MKRFQMKTMLLWLLLMGFVAGSFFLAEPIKNFPKILPAFQAKEFCSCLFVLEQSEDFCKELVRQYLPHRDLVINRDTKSIEVIGYFASRKAFWKNPHEGCQLERMSP